MKETEIRINNWFYHKGKHWSYRNEGASNGFEFQWDSRDWYAIGECTLSLEDIEPIQLTEEWLFKFGFELKYEDEEDNSIFVKNLFEITKDCFKEVFWSDATYIIKNVHQLQNLYAVLTGEELKLKK